MPFKGRQAGLSPGSVEQVSHRFTYSFINPFGLGVIKVTEKQQTIIDLLYGEKTDPAPEIKPEAASKAALDPLRELGQLKEEALACRRCQLREGCSQVVFGDGKPDAGLMMVGEGPGADEDRIGVPFVGRAGQLLDRILEAAKIDRRTIFITNVVKCRPPGNRLPLQPEVDACLPYLHRQIELINPDIIVCLGSLATKTLVNKNAAITRDRGKWHEIEGRKVIATFHPAALLRDPSRKKDVWEDFKEIMKYYRQE